MPVTFSIFYEESLRYPIRTKKVDMQFFHAFAQCTWIDLQKLRRTTTSTDFIFALLQNSENMRSRHVIQG